MLRGAARHLGAPRVRCLPPRADEKRLAGSSTAFIALHTAMLDVSGRRAGSSSVKVAWVTVLCPALPFLGAHIHRIACQSWGCWCPS